MKKSLKLAISDARWDRDSSGMASPTKRELARRLKEVDKISRSPYHNGDDLIDEQHDLINALLVFLERTLSD